MKARTLSSYWRFLRAAVTNSSQTGAIIPSQRFLIDRMIAPIPTNYRGQIFELGPGTGALTLRLAARCPHARILACEINPMLAQDIRRNLDATALSRRVRVVSDAAENFLENLGRNGVERPDYVVSGIPLGNLEKKAVLRLIQAIHKALNPNGLYVQFQYSLLDRKKIVSHFRRFRTIPVPFNFPPAFVYYAQK